MKLFGFLDFPGIAENAINFAAEFKRLKLPFYEMKPGETIFYRGKQLVKNNAENQISK